MNTETATMNSLTEATPVLAKRFSFREFLIEMEKLMMLDNLDIETKHEYLNDWYSIFKEQKQDTVLSFVNQNFPLSEVNQNTHHFFKR